MPTGVIPLPAVHFPYALYSRLFVEGFAGGEDGKHDEAGFDELLLLYCLLFGAESFDGVFFAGAAGGDGAGEDG